MTGELLWVGSAPMSSGSNYLPSGATVLSTIPPELAEAISGVSEMERTLRMHLSRKARSKGPFTTDCWGRGGKLGARVAGMLVGIGLMVLPVFARKTLIHGTPVFSTMTGELLWVGSAPMSSGSNYLPSGATVLSTIPPELAEAISGVSEMERNRLFAAAAAETILADPSAFGSRIFQKFVYFWTFAPQTGVSYPASYKAIYLLYYAAVVVLAGLGLWRWHQARELGPALFLIGGLFLAVSLTHAVLYFEMRHRWALEPLILIFSAAGLIGPPHSAIEEGS